MTGGTACGYGRNFLTFLPAHWRKTNRKQHMQAAHQRIHTHTLTPAHKLIVMFSTKTICFDKVVFPFLPGLQLTNPSRRHHL